MKVQVTVEMEFDRLPEDSVRELARQIVEQRGLNVLRITVPTVKGEGRPFEPKAGKPGSKLLRDGKMFTVWGDHPNRGVVWATLEGSPLYWAVDGRGAEPVHADGTRHDTWRACSCGVENAA